MEVMSAAAARPCSASVSTLACTMSGWASDDASKIGANWRHGPHHDAQKSTSTISLLVTVFSKAASVSSTVGMVCGPLGQLARDPGSLVLTLVNDGPRQVF